MISTFPSSARRAITALSMKSSVFEASMRPSEVLPIRWPDRPTRCMRRVICRGELYWRTKSVLPTSIPSSRDEVQISALRAPFLKLFSASIRACLEREP